MNYCDDLFNVNPEWLERTVLIDAESGRKYSFRELQSCIRRFAGLLSKSDYKPGSIVILHLYNGAEVVIAHLACQYAGLVTCLIDPMFKPAELEYYITDAGADLVITHLPIKEGRLEFMPDTKALHVSDVQQACEETELEQILPKMYDYMEDEVCLLLYTSGSTSKPKGVMHTPRTGRTNLEIQAEIGYTYAMEDRLVCFVPFSHGYGCIYLLLPTFYYRASIVMMRSFQPQKLAALIETEGVTHLFGVPTHFMQLLKYESIFPQLKKLKAAFSAAAPLNQQTARQWKEKLGLYLDEGYGLTETSTLITFRGGCVPEDPCNIGVGMCKCGQVDVVDEAGSIVPCGVVGELRVKGRNVALGYWNKLAATKDKFRDGWFYTGDYAYRNSKGELVLSGRKPEFVNVAGIKVSPIDVEAVLNAHPAVAESAIIGVDDETYGEVVKGFVVLKEGMTATERELVRHVANLLSSYSVPKYIDFMEQLPRNNMGKVDKNLLKVVGI